VSRRGSAENGSTALDNSRRGSKDAGPNGRELQRLAGLQHASDAYNIVRRQLKATLQDYADRVRYRRSSSTDSRSLLASAQGDSQICAVVCCVLQEKDLDFDRLWLARVTKTYLGPSFWPILAVLFG
jgi:hypothetical protein